MLAEGGRVGRGAACPCSLSIASAPPAPVLFVFTYIPMSFVLFFVCLPEGDVNCDEGSSPGRLGGRVVGGTPRVAERRAGEVSGGDQTEGPGPTKLRGEKRKSRRHFFTRDTNGSGRGAGVGKGRHSGRGAPLRFRHTCLLSGSRRTLGRSK